MAEQATTNAPQAVQRETDAHKEVSQLPQNSPFLGLPAELLKEISEQGLAPSDLLNLMRCNHHLSKTYAPYLHKRAIANRGDKPAIIYAIENGNFKLVQYLLEKGYDELPEDPPWPALNAAIFKGELEIIRELTEHLIGAREDDFFDFADQASSGLCYLVYNVADCDALTVEALLGIGANPNGDNPLGFMLRSSKRPEEQIPDRELLFEVTDPEIMELLLEQGADINISLQDGTSLLDNAVAQHEYHDVLQVLLEKFDEYSSEARQAFSAEPLHTAAESPRMSTADLLLSHGFEEDMHAPDSSGETPIHIAARAEESRAIPFIHTLMLNGADIDCLGNGDLPTPLLVAADASNWDTVMFLHQNGADASEKTIDGRTVFHYLVDRGDADQHLMEYLLNAEEDLGMVGLESKDNRGWTAFESLYCRAFRDLKENNTISSRIRGMVKSVMTWLNDRPGKGGMIGDSYRLLWNLSEHQEGRRLLP